jgi:uncharacterized membrane protein (DUF4010 family)
MNEKARGEPRSPVGPIVGAAVSAIVSITLATAAFGMTGPNVTLALSLVGLIAMLGLMIAAGLRFTSGRRRRAVPPPPEPVEAASAPRPRDAPESGSDVRPVMPSK